MRRSTRKAAAMRQDYLASRAAAAVAELGEAGLGLQRRRWFDCFVLPLHACMATSSLTALSTMHEIGCGVVRLGKVKRLHVANTPSMQY